MKWHKELSQVRIYSSDSMIMGRLPMLEPLKLLFIQTRDASDKDKT